MYLNTGKLGTRMVDSIRTPRVEGLYAKSHLIRLAKNVKENTVFVKEGEKVWICTNCGHIHVGKNAPEVCPVCAHPQAYFKILNEEF